MQVVGLMALLGAKLVSKRSAPWEAVAVSATGARRRRQHHSATANEYCPSSSAVVRHIFHDLASSRDDRTENVVG